MSLTSQINNSHSPISRWMESTFSRDGVRLLVQEINDQLARATPIRHGGSPTMVGRALDYGVRWSAGPLGDTVAHRGARRCREQYGWGIAEEVLAAVLAAGGAPGDLLTRARCCLALSWFEGVGRGDAPDPELARALDSTTVQRALRWLLVGHGDADVDDVAALLATVPEVWGDELRGAVMNPAFSGSALVGGADADWICGDTLWECKTSGKNRPMSRRYMLQALGYALLDTDDGYGIRAIGWYFARHRLRVRYALDELLYRVLEDTDRSLPELRAELRGLLLSQVRLLIHTPGRTATQALRAALLDAWPAFADREAAGEAIVRAHPLGDIARLAAAAGAVDLAQTRSIEVGVVVGGRWAPLIALIDGDAVRWTRRTTPQPDDSDGLAVAWLPAEQPIGSPFWREYARAVQRLLAAAGDGPAEGDRRSSN